jgi:hypothetical protein
VRKREGRERKRDEEKSAPDLSFLKLRTHRGKKKKVDGY